MINEIINILLYVIALVVYWRKNKKVDTYFVLLFAYFITAVMCYLYMKSGQSHYHTTIFPYIYLFACILICLHPFKNLDIGRQIMITETPLIKTLTWIYIISGLLSIYYTLPDAVLLLQSDEWNTLRNQLYEDSSSIELYSSQTERFAKNLNNYLSPFGIIMCFYNLVKCKKSWYMLILLFVVWLGTSFLSATLVASRGIVANLILKVALIFVIFWSAINAKTKRLFIIFMLILTIPAMTYMMAVSVSRFGEGSAANDSIFMYLGHSMLNFNENMFGVMHSYAWGQYAFDYFIKLFGGDPLSNYKVLGYTGGTGFYTYIGSFFMDWGIVGTMLVCILLSTLIMRFTKKQNKSISDLIIIVYAASFIMNGVFVIGAGYMLQWIMIWVVYCIVKKTEKLY